MHVLVNVEGVLPGYRIACSAQTDYVLREADPKKEDITQDDLTPADVDYFIADSHMSLQDHLVAFTDSMPTGAYILPPPDLDGTMGKEIDDLLKDE